VSDADQLHSRVRFEAPQLDTPVKNFWAMQKAITETPYPNLKTNEALPPTGESCSQVDRVGWYLSPLVPMPLIEMVCVGTPPPKLRYQGSTYEFGISPSPAPG
jgi:hypothetical protein